MTVLATPPSTAAIAPDPRSIFGALEAPERRHVAPFPFAGRVWFWGDDGAVWCVREVSYPAPPGWPQAVRSLWFEGATCGRRVRGYPPGWADLSRNDLVTLSHER